MIFFDKKLKNFHKILLIQCVIMGDQRARYELFKEMICTHNILK